MRAAPTAIPSDRLWGTNGDGLTEWMEGVKCVAFLLKCSKASTANSDGFLSDE